MRKFIAALAGLIALVGIIALVQGTSNAAPVGASVQTDVLVTNTVADSNGFFTTPLGSPVDLNDDAVAFATITNPTGALPSLPNSLRFVEFVVDDNETEATTDDRITGVRWRAFSHQMVRDPSGNYRLGVYVGQINIFQRVTSGGSAYCAANPCS